MCPEQVLHLYVAMMRGKVKLTINIAPTTKQISSWIKDFVPEKDLFFIEEKDLIPFENNLNKLLIIPSGEFFRHPSYRQIKFSNSYTYWNISKSVDYVLVTSSSWITNLCEEKKREVLSKQINMGRGLILPLAFFADATLVPKEYIFEEGLEQKVVIQYQMWNDMPFSLKENAIKKYAILWDDWKAEELPDSTPDHIRNYANTFTINSGSNCLSSTLFAVTKQEWIIKEWVHPETFVNGIERAGYFITTKEIQNGDIIIWVNESDVVQHATYYIGNDLCFNKNGQTFFNPWKIVNANSLNEEWSHYKKKVYSKQ